MRVRAVLRKYLRNKIHLRNSQSRKAAGTVVLSHHPLFQADYYVRQVVCAGLQLNGTDPWLHYITIGDFHRLNPHPLFDTDFYHSLYPDVAAAGKPALVHYIEYGAAEGRRPHPLIDVEYIKEQTLSQSDPLIQYITAVRGSINPDRYFRESYVLESIGNELEKNESVLQHYLSSSHLISPSPDFDAADYIRRYPYAKNVNPLYHYKRWGHAEGLAIFPITASLEGVKLDLEFAATLDPAILPPYVDCESLPRVIIADARSGGRELLSILLRKLDNSRRAVVFFIEEDNTDEYFQFIAPLICACQSQHSTAQIMIIVTGKVRMQPQPLQDKKTCEVVYLGDIVCSMAPNTAALTIANFIQILPKNSICVINSKLGWLLVERHGFALRRTTLMMGCAFFYTYDNFGRRAGYSWTELPYAVDHLDYVITNDTAFVKILKSDLRLSQANCNKFCVLRPPFYKDVEILLKTNTENVDIFSGRRGCLVCVDRYNSKDQFAKLFEIARAIPEIEFCVISENGIALEIDKMECPSNIISRVRKYLHFPLRTESIIAVLSTSNWAGTPRFLLEAAYAKLPIIASGVGGAGVFLTNETGWPISAPRVPDDYVDALRKIIQNPDVAMNKAFRLSESITELFSADRYFRDVKLLFSVESRLGEVEG
ncbi:glycosyltransferase [Methylobacterium segetis]|uniref:glycosyltransferase n=1 Tax=Methylobacterium segetis TaxID=2488750 RepID=UPI00105022B7|nr:glycosyltransferase [Methylobacterium segetis]